MKPSKHPATTLHPLEIIRKAKKAIPYAPGEIQLWVSAITAKKIPDYQITAWLMAVRLNGLLPNDALELTRAMKNSGTTLRWPKSASPLIDKHSTGGVGDKVTIILAPLLAACGVAVPSIAGRGLGHTGGTIDKLESIPGYSANLTPKTMQSSIRQAGCFIASQTKDLAPADKILYALRDVTETVDCIPLIVSSILSKKLAAHPDALVLDVKCGDGAFMEKRKDALALARALQSTAEKLGLPCSAAVTDMNEPLGWAVGNAIEINECVEVLQGTARPSSLDLLELTLELGQEMLRLANPKMNQPIAREILLEALTSGKALANFYKMLIAQGASPSKVKSYFPLPLSPLKTELKAQATGFVSAIASRQFGTQLIDLGGGRSKATDKITHGAGVELLKKVGDPVRKGEPWLRIYSERRPTPETLSRLSTCMKVSTTRPRSNKRRLIQWIRSV